MITTSKLPSYKHRTRSVRLIRTLTCLVRTRDAVSDSTATGSVEGRLGEPKGVFDTRGWVDFAVVV